MIINNNQIEQKIEELLQELDSGKNTSFLHTELSKLHHQIFFVHTFLDGLINQLIAKFLAKEFHTHTKNSLDENLVLFGYAFSLYKILDEIDFARKIKILQKYRILSKNTPLTKKLFQVNDIRNYFSHPLTYSKKLSSYRKRENYLEILYLLQEAKNSMERLVQKHSSIKSKKL
jgi:hypothetical protein